VNKVRCLIDKQTARTVKRAEASSLTTSMAYTDQTSLHFTASSKANLKLNSQAGNPLTPASAFIIPAAVGALNAVGLVGFAMAVLIVGASRGLGASLVQQYASTSSHVFGTSRSAKAPDSSKNISYIPNIDVAKEDAGPQLVKAIKPTSRSLDTVIITAGYFATETFDEPSWEDELKMYTISSIGPVFIVHHLVKAGLLNKGSKIVLVSSESGSITLRHESEGGGNYAHHASKTALNMVGKLLSLDLKDKGIAVLMVHPGFMRTEMTKSVGFDKFWDEAGAITPDVAAQSLRDFVNKCDMEHTGEYWAPRGPGGIGTAEVVLGKGLETPLKLPW